MATIEPRDASGGEWALLRRRAGAYLADIALLFLVLGPLGFFVQRAAGLTPSTGPEIWQALLVNFSLPTWAYFALADASRGGATFGKRWTAVRVTAVDGGRVAPLRALARTALKLLPWELVHVSAFGLAGDGFTVIQSVGLAVANVLAFAYLACAVGTRGRRSVHDFVAGTVVRTAA